MLPARTASRPARIIRHLRRAVVFACGAAFLALPASADNVLDQTSDTIETSHDETSVGFRSGAVVVAPIPFSNPTIGAGLALGAGYLFTADDGSKPSVLGIGGFRSDNGSEGYGLTVNLALRNNTWLFKSFFGVADVFYDLFTPFGILPIRQQGNLARVALAYGVTSELSFGGVLRYLDTSISSEVPGLPPIPPPFDRDLRTEILTYGLTALWDRRDDAVYPSNGSRLSLEATRSTELNGRGQDYNKAFANFDLYRPIGDRGVVAARLSACGASSAAPFFDQCFLGGTDSFRGFSATQFLDQRSTSLQIEYRHAFNQRLGGVAFAGAGYVGPSFDQLTTGGLHSAAGIGLRYRVSKKFPLDFSIDGTLNNLNERNLYLYVGQRF